MPHLKNYRGATNYFFPSNKAYRDNYDQIFGKKADAQAQGGACEHDWKPVPGVDEHEQCAVCHVTRESEAKP